MVIVVMKDGPYTIAELKKELELFPDTLQIRWDGCCDRKMQLHSLSSSDGRHLIFDFFAPIG